MDLKEYVLRLVDKFEVHRAYKAVVNNIINLEHVGFSEFAANNFKSVRDRAALAMPYQVKPKHVKERKRVLDFLELLILRHRQEKHDEDHSKRIAAIEENTVFTVEERVLIADPRGFWGA